MTLPSVHAGGSESTSCPHRHQGPGHSFQSSRRMHQALLRLGTQHDGEQAIVWSETISLGCRALRVVNPSPYMVYLQARGSILVASSPEILCRLGKDRIVTNRWAAILYSVSRWRISLTQLSISSFRVCLGPSIDPNCLQCLTAWSRQESEAEYRAES